MAATSANAASSSSRPSDGPGSSSMILLTAAHSGDEYGLTVGAEPKCGWSRTGSRSTSASSSESSSSGMTSATASAALSLARLGPLTTAAAAVAEPRACPDSRGVVDEVVLEVGDVDDDRERAVRGPGVLARVAAEGAETAVPEGNFAMVAAFASW